MDNVVELHPPKREIWKWRCVCKSTHFELHHGGHVVCAGCGKIADNVRHFNPEYPKDSA